MRTNRRILSAFLLAVAVLAGCGGGAQPAQGGATTGGSASAQGVERWLVRFSPDEWKVISSHDNGQQMMTEFIPPDEAVETWSRMLTVQLTRNTPVTVTEFYERIGAGFTQACETVRLAMLPQQSQGGYDVHIALVYCGRNPATGQGEVVHFKVVKGRDALYVAQYARRTAPFDANQQTGISTEEARGMIETLTGTLVCMDGGQEPTCPAEFSGID